MLIYANTPDRQCFPHLKLRGKANFNQEWALLPGPLATVENSGLLVVVGAQFGTDGGISAPHVTLILMIYI